MGLEKTDQGCEQRRFVRPLAKGICPDSGQVQEPPRPPFVGERGSKRCEGKGMGIVWRLTPHRLRLFRSY
jgi:hypothetical protein